MNRIAVWIAAAFLVSVASPVMAALDAASAKQGKFMPGSHIPIMPPAVLEAQPPDYLLILPWNIASEIKQQNAWLSELDTKFVTAVPKLDIT